MNREHANEDTAGITRALEDAVEDARRLHRAFGQPLIVWEDGRLQFLDPDTLAPVAPVTLPELPLAGPSRTQPEPDAGA